MHFLILLLAATLHLFTPAYGQWSANPSENTVVCTAMGNQTNCRNVSDGSGGVIIVWNDQRSGPSRHIYAQRLNAQGVPQWSADGVPICTAQNDRTLGDAIADGAGGVFIAWNDARNTTTGADIYVQRVNANGQPLWTANGVAVCTATRFQGDPKLTSDGAGGVIVAWYDERSATSWTAIYAQGVDSNGATRWTTNGVSVATATGNQMRPVLTPDGSGGAIIAWEEGRAATFLDIVVQRLSANGAQQWGTSGVSLTSLPTDEERPQIICDGAGGAIIAWLDTRNVVANDIYAQRVNSQGNAQWITQGTPICISAATKADQRTASDGAGGAYLVWTNNDAGMRDIYAGRIDSAGVTYWQTFGIPVCADPGWQEKPGIIPDGAGGAIVVWEDARSGLTDLYAQRFNALGQMLWTPNGVAISTAPSAQYVPQIASDGARGAIIAWEDLRNGSHYDNYAQQINANGQLGVVTGVPYGREVPNEFHLTQNYPNPFNPNTRIEYALPQAGYVTLSVYNVLGQHVATLVDEQRFAGRYSVEWNGTSANGRTLGSGVYLYTMIAWPSAGGETFRKTGKMVLVK